MKTLFCSLLSCVFLFSSFATKAVTLPVEDGLGPKITLSFEFGRRSKGCSNVGFCRFRLESVNIESGIGGENTATGTAWIEKGKLKIEFNRASMTEQTYQTHFGSGIFQLEEDYVLPDEVAAALGVRSYIIKTGKYMVPQTNGESNTVLVSY